jgi:hypothetical protein
MAERNWYLKNLALSLIAPELFGENPPENMVIQLEMSKINRNWSQNPKSVQIKKFSVAPLVPTLAVKFRFFYSGLELKAEIYFGLV